MSHDGVTWFAGSGAYGKGWGEVGKGISVATGATFYAKYYSDTPTHAPLHFAPHGAEWGSWHTLGPVLSDTIQTSASKPIILKFQYVGTPRSTVTWVNGSGTWSGLVFPGNYDLALGREAAWTLPPVTITPPAEPRSWWRALFGPSEARAAAGMTSVPDGGGTALLLGLALLGIAAVWFAIKHRRGRHPHSGDGSKT